jgi:hypothetical protein
MGVLAVRLQALEKELEWDGTKMEFTNIGDNETIRIVIKDGFEIHEGHPTFNKDWTEPVNAKDFTKDGRNCQGLLYNEDYDGFTSSITEEWKPYTSYNNKYAALCSSENSGCSGFIDPMDNLDLNDYIYSKSGVALNYNHHILHEQHDFQL